MLGLDSLGTSLSRAALLSATLLALGACDGGTPAGDGGAGAMDSGSMGTDGGGCPAGETMCWLGMPMVRPTKLRGRVQHLNEIFAAKMSEHEGRHFVDTWPLLATPEGEYAEHKTIDGKKVKLRGNDGVHLTVKGAHYVADELAPAVQAALG